MTFAETVHFLFSLGPELKTVKWDLEKIRALMRELGDPQERCRFIHVAGTNGKGSTCAMIESALRMAGLRTGLYTSPHLIDPRERIQIGGENISEPEWTRSFEKVHAAAERLLARETIAMHPSFFETVTAMALLTFADVGTDIAVVETGLGGRLDATNIVVPEIAVLTPIDFDHEAFLGSHIESIAREKAGILKPGRPAVTARQRPEAMAVIERRAAEVGATITESREWRIEEGELHHPFGSRFRLAGRREIEIECPLAGAHQIENAQTAVSVLTLLGVDAEDIRQGIARTVWPGRLERICENPMFILDGAHNPAGARALSNYIRAFFFGEPVRIIYGAMRDKAVEEITATLFPLAREIVLTAPRQPRALSPESIAALTGHPAVRIAPNVEDAIGMARRTPMTTFITGSLFLVGEARARLNRDRKA
jgi:dihydrofolate synthase/folylpolyglutamate synthase